MTRTARVVGWLAAAALGAAIVARATAARLRRRRPPPETGFIDITDVVRSQGSPG